MNKTNFQKWLKKWGLYLLAIVFLVGALFMYLDFFPAFVQNDEATRGVVALEMIISGNYITPTIHGEFYYCKPPIFNWLLILFYNIFGNLDEFALRLPSLLFLFIWFASIFFFVKKEYGPKVGLLTALVFLTNIRMLMFEAYFCQIDMPFACLVYTGMMVIYFYKKRGNFWMLFALSYFIAALTFLLKGLPSIVFQGITLLVIFGNKRDFKKLFMLQHFVGVLAFIIPVGLYYYFYSQQNSIETIFSVILSESTHRTIVDYSIWRSIFHFSVFPLEVLYHYTPWTFLVIFMFSRKFWKILNQNSFLKFNLLVFLFNLPVYWLAPGFFPKYIIMLIPLFYTVLIYIFVEKAKEFPIQMKIITIAFRIFGILILLYLLTVPFIDLGFDISYVYLKSFGLASLAGIFVYLSFKNKKDILLYVVFILLIAKVSFNWFNWINRYPEVHKYKSDAVEVARMVGDKDLRYYNMRITQWGTTYYMTKENMQIIENDTEDIIPEAYYVIDDKALEKVNDKNMPYKILYKFETKEGKKKLNLVKFDE